MATITSNQSGNWSNPTTWTGGVVPSTGDKAIIGAGHTVTVDTNVNIGDGTNQAVNVSALGSLLKFHRTNDITFEVTGSIYGLNNTTGGIDIGREGDPCTGNITIQLNKGGTNGDNSSSGPVGTLFLQNSSIWIQGNEKKTNTLTQSPEISGATQIDVVDRTGWQVGDRIVIKRIDSFSISSKHYTTIASFGAGNIVNIADALPFGLTADARVGNLTKNITIEKHPSIGNNIDTRFVLRQMGGSTISIDQVEFRNMLGSTSNFQQGVSLDSSNSFRPAMSNVTIHNPNGDGVCDGVDIHQFRTSTGTFDDWAFGITSDRSTIQMRSAGGIVANRWVLYDGGQISSAWGDGGSGMLYKNCELWNNRRPYCYSGTAVISTRFEKCLIMGGNAGDGYMTLTNIGLLEFIDCTFGSNAGNFNIQKTRIFSTAGEEFKTIVNIIGGSTTSSGVFGKNDIIEYSQTIDSTAFDKLNATSFLTTKSFNSAEDRTYTPFGFTLAQNTLFNLGEKAIQLVKSINDSQSLKALYEFFLPNNVNARVSGLARFTEASYTHTIKPRISISSDSGIDENQSLVTADIWESFELTALQNTGNDELVNVDFESFGEEQSECWLDFVAISAFGYRTILFNNPISDINRQLIAGSLSVIPQITLTELEASNLTGLTLTFETTPQTSFGENFSITLLADFTVNPNLTLNDIQTWYYYHSNRIQAFAGQETGYHLQEHLPFGQAVSVRKEYSGVQKGMRVIDQNGNIPDGFTSIQADNGNTVNNEKVTINATTPVDFDNEVKIFNSLTDAEDELNEISTGTTFFYQANQLGGNTVFFRMEKADGSFIIDSYILPSTAGVYDITLVVTDTDNSLNELLAINRKIHAMIELNAGQYRFTTKALEQAPSGGGNTDTKGFIN